MLNRTFSGVRLEPAYPGSPRHEEVAKFAASQTIARGTILGIVSADGTFKAYSSADIAAPVAAPAVVDGATGSLVAGNYEVAYTYVNASGETTISPVFIYTSAGTKKGNVSAVTPLPAGVLSVNWYISAVGDNDLKLFKNNNGSAFVFDLTDLPTGAQPGRPLNNTATAATDGSQRATAICMYDIVVDASNNVTFGLQANSEWGADKSLTAAIYIGGCFNVPDLVGLDATAIAQLGRLIHGTISSNGVLKLN